MSGSITRTGVTWKLVNNRDDTVLGTVTFPDHWEARLTSPTGWVRVAFPLEMDLSVYWKKDFDMTVPQRSFVIERSHRVKGAVQLHGATPEEFEKIPGCSFAPGAAYLRSLLG